MNDNILYQKIGQLLVDAGPVDAQKLIVRAEVFPEGDSGRYEFDYVDAFGITKWFDPDGRAVGDLTDFLIQLRYYFATNKLSANGGEWSGCEINLDVESMKIKIDFKYE